MVTGVIRPPLPPPRYVYSPFLSRAEGSAFHCSSIFIKNCYLTPSRFPRVIFCARKIPYEYDQYYAPGGTRTSEIDLSNNEVNPLDHRGRRLVGAHRQLSGYGSYLTKSQSGVRLHNMDSVHGQRPIDVYCHLSVENDSFVT